MLEIILDTETTGLSTSEKHRIVEIGCIEINNQIPTNKVFHHYINPQRPVSEDAFKIHGYSNEFLSKQKTFTEISENFLNFIKNKKIVIHNAQFDLSFLNYELKLIKKDEIKLKDVVDTLDLARKKFPGSQNSLDALCKRFKVDNSRREKHSALLDCELLLEVYVNLLDQKEPKFDFIEKNFPGPVAKKIINKEIFYSKKIIKPTQKEIEQHKLYIKTDLKKNFYK